MQSFNLIISLHEHGKLDSYYNEELSCLEHFKLKEFFLRRTKNVYISFVSKRLVQEMASSEPVPMQLLSNG